MIQDNGPRYNLGSGVPPQGLERGDGNSNLVEKALNGNPVMRFFAVAGASIVSMGIAGKIVREGGIRFAYGAQKVATGGGKYAERAKEGIHAFRKIEDTLDALQGLNREVEDPLTLVRKVGNKLVRDKTNVIDSFNQRFDSDSLPGWAMRDELQQRLVAQARRLPYEAPGLYVAQKAILDPLFGENDKPENKVNWKNPFDVIGDFSYETLKNLSINVLPFEVGSGALKNSYQTYAAKALTQPGNKQYAFLTAKTTLNQMGIEFGNLMDKTIRMSHQSIGAFSTTIQTATENSASFSQFVKARNAAMMDAPKYANSNFARRTFMQAQEIVQNKNGEIRQAIDALPSPFRGMGTGIARGKRSFTEIGETYDNWQNVISGKTQLATLKKNKPEQYNNLLNFMRKGGGTHLEQYAEASFDLGRGGLTLPDGKVNQDWKNGSFYRLRSQQVYRGMLADEIHKSTGLTPEASLKFVRSAEHISPVAGNRAPAPGGSQLFERFRYTSQKFQGDLSKTHEQNSVDWWNNLVKGAGKHGINFQGDQAGLDAFSQAVKQADYRFTTPSFQEALKGQAQREWKMLHGQIIAPEATKALSTVKKPYELFSNVNLENNRDFLVQRAASRLGINVVDNTGNPIPRHRIENQLRSKGFNPGNLKKLRGFLVDKKEIAAPWSTDGANVFGFKPLNLQQAMQNNYFGAAADSKGVRDEISMFVNQKTFSPLVGRGGSLSSVHVNQWDLKVNKVFVGKNGKVLDFGRIGRNLISGVNKIQNEFQIPLIHLKPLQMGGWSSFQAMRNSPAILMAPGDSVQPIAMAAGKEFKKPDFYMYMKSSTKTSKGKVVGITSSAAGDIERHDYSGLYRPFTTNVKNMLGRYSNVMMGEKDIPSSQKQESRWKRLFDVSYDQENSIAFGKDSVANRWLRAYKRKPEAYKNPFVTAEHFGSKLFNPSSLTTEQSEGFNKLVTTLRGYGFSNKTLRELSDSPEFQQTFMMNLGGNATNMLDIQDQLLPSVVRQVLKNDQTLLRSSGASAQQVGRLQQNVKNLLSQGEKQSGYWDLNAPDSVKMTGISRRVDQLKGEFFDYLLVRSDALSGVASGSFDDTVQRLMTNLETMFAKGAISQAEKAEGRAAILSLQVDHTRNAVYKAGAFPVEHTQATLEALFAKGDHARELFAEVGSGKTSYPNEFVKRKASAFFRPVPYERPFQNNPTGTDHTFMPTFGTTYARNPLKAIKGVVGASWRDPKAMSAAQMPITHLSVRLNKYFENFGLGLDETRYQSPIDFYARGIIGKRVLPIYAAGVTALAVDRTVGGAVNEDKDGNPVYAPFVLGKVGGVIASGQVGLAGIVPGGQTAEEKRKELDSGEVPIRKGRYWLLGNTPFKGGRIQYFRPSWYQRLKSGSTYTPEMNETPMEKLAFGYDFSPLRPFDRYRREREDYGSRPYPLTGEYFTGPWGPLSSVLNGTIGKILKPSKRMHTEETKYMLGQYQPVGESGAYFPTSPISSGGYGAAQNLSSINAGYSNAGPGTHSSAPFYGAMGYSNPRGLASTSVRQTTTDINQSYSNPGGISYSVPSVRGKMNPRVVSAGGVLDYSTTSMASRRLGYQSQELFGIYGFAEASAREGLGMGSKDLAPKKSVLEPASRGYSTARSFWNMQIGGIGDLPLPIEGRFSNLEISEIIRRFVPKEPAGISYVNNIPNTMGKIYPWLPGADYPLANVKSGDPYNSMPDAEMRLPGTGYARTHQMFPDRNGKLGLVNIHDILGDIAPWSEEFNAIDGVVGSNLSREEMAKVSQTRAQVEAMRYSKEFTPYQYKYNSSEEMIKHPTSFALGRGWEWLTHRDTYLNTKLGAPETAVEDWERNNVYGSTFPSWENPVSSFLKPAINKATQRNPLAAAAAGASLGYLFGSSHQSKAVGAVLGAAVTSSASLFGAAYEGITGRRYIPIDRKKEAAIEEYADIFEYVRSSRASSRAASIGDFETAKLFKNQANSTMYGMDFNSVTPEKLAMAIPKRKRENFRAMLYAPEQEREQILSTAPRLERRMLEAAWGMPVEDKPDLKEYFENHELPPPTSDIWTNNISQDTLKIKMGQSLGLDLAQMGYYPQQIQEANLLNPSYPSLNKKQNGFSISAQIKRFLFDRNISGTVLASPSPSPGNRLQLNAGTYG